MMYHIWFYGNFCFLPKILHGSIDYQSCSQSKILDSAWPQLFIDVLNLILWYFLLLTLDFAWKFNLSNFLQVSNFVIYMTRSFQWSTTFAYTCFCIILNFIFGEDYSPPLIIFYIYIFLRTSILHLYFVHIFLNFAMSTFYFFYFTWLLVFCMCSSTLVVATRDGNGSLRNLCKMAALQVF